MLPRTLACFWIFAVAGGARNPTLFDAPTAFHSLPSDPFSMVAADFNGDGKPDLAVAQSGGAVQIQLGNGDGTFSAPLYYDLFDKAIALGAGDFNHDGKLDLAVSNGRKVSILLGNGDGSFRMGADYVVGGPREPAQQIVVGDFNGDGNPDLAVDAAGTIILLGHGDGTFSQSASNGPGSLLFAADFNGDGKLDLAGSGGGGIAIALGTGNGTFQPPIIVASGGFDSLAAGDFNGDGKLDLAAGSYPRGHISIFLGNGDGTFRTGASYAETANSRSLATGDFNGDGKADLATDGGTVLLGDGDGSFRKSAGFLSPEGPDGIVVADFNGDGRQDLAVASAKMFSVYVLLGQGGATFQRPGQIALASATRSVAVGDFNGDGKADLAVTMDSTLAILLGKGDGTFRAPVTYSAGASPGSIATADLNGDGKLDLVVAMPVYNGQNGTVSVYLGNGDGTFQTAQSYGVDVIPVWVAVADFNGDGKPDLAVANHGPGGFPNIAGSVSILLGNGDGTFGAAMPLPFGEQVFSVAAGDFNGDGKPDLAVALSNGQENQGEIAILLGSGDGTFQKAASYTALYDNGSPVVVGDFNGDGKLDLASGSGNAFFVMLGHGDGTFQAAQSFYEPGADAGVIVAGDFNGDGKLDLALANSRINTVTIELGRGDGTFLPGLSFETGQSPCAGGIGWGWLAVGDFHGDGKPDIAATTRRGLAVLKSTAN